MALQRLKEKGDLRVIFDDKHSFKQHIDKITRKSYQMLGFIFRSTKTFKKPNSLIRLYNGYVRTRLEYCSQVWNPMYEMYASSLERVQKKFTRMLHYRYLGSKPDYTTRLKNLNMHSLETRRLVADEKLLYNIIHNRIDTSLASQLHFNIPQRTTRNQPMFYLPTPPSNIVLNSPLHRIQNRHNKCFPTIDLLSPKYNRFITQLNEYYNF